MPQTMLGLLALALASLLSMQQQQVAVDKQMNRIRSELAVHSTSVAEDLLNVIGTMAFDGNTANPDIPPLTSSLQLTPASQFGAGSGEASAIEDFHQNVGQQFTRREIRRLDAATGQIRTDTLRFAIDARVSYVDERDLATVLTNGQSKAKKVDVKVYSTTVSRPDTIRLSRSYVCATKCAW